MAPRKAIERLGHAAPVALGDQTDFVYNDETGMEYEVYETNTDGQIYLGASHEDVGLMTYYRCPDIDTAYAATEDR